MTNGSEFWHLSSLSDQELLQGLDGTIRSGRRATAELVAHLAEVDERRLHLRAACPSLFSYCVTRLGFSEDEACRRIEVARLARRHPTIFMMLASGEISLSVAALLRPVLASGNSGELLAAVAGKTVQGAREVLAARFPRPDVPSLVRKLPERRTNPPTISMQPAAEAPLLGTPAPSSTPRVSPQVVASSASTESPSTESRSAESPSPEPRSPELRSPEPRSPELRLTESRSTESRSTEPGSTEPPSTESRRDRAQRITPLAPARYKVEFTADAELKAKLELARDLLRHANPSGDFAPIVARALELLITEIQKRKFGACSPGGRTEGCVPRSATAAAVSNSIHAEPSSSRVPRSTRRQVAERDGLRCTWTDDTGLRCGSQAWLEHDHREPRAKGGGSEAANVRLLCRAHNRLEAEREFGRRKVADEIERAREARQVRRQPFADPRSLREEGRASGAP